jgi:hypothetical protein
VADEEWSPFHVQVGCVDAAGNFELLGSGVVIQAQRVLTSHHVIKMDEANLAVAWRAGAKRIRATVKGKDEDTDVAVLETEAAFPGSPAGLGASGKVSANQPVEISGYPSVRSNRPSKKVEKVNGSTAGMDQLDSPLLLNMLAVPGEWDGLSGAAVRINGVVVGVVRAFPNGWVDKKRLDAVPLSRFVSKPWFLGALEPLSRDDQYLARVADLLKDAPVLRRHLQAELKVGGSGETEIARAFCKLMATDGVKMADIVMAKLRKQTPRCPAEERALQSILGDWLPHAVDWQAVQAQLVLARMSGRAELVLPFRLETVAEIICARADGRPCAFVPLANSTLLSGVGFLSWPAAAYAPMVQNERLIRDALIERLCKEFGIAREGEPKSLLAALEARLADDLDNPELEFPFRRSLLVIDDVLGGGEAGMHAWTIVNHVEVGLPSLRRLRLTGGEKAHGEDTGLAKRLERIYKKDIL